MKRRVERVREGVNARVNATAITSGMAIDDGHCWNCNGNSSCLAFTNAKETVPCLTQCIQCTQAGQATLLANATMKFPS